MNISETANWVFQSY